MRVRLATPPDARGIAEVHVAAWKEGYRGLVDGAILDGLSADDREQVWRGHLSDDANEIRTLVAEDDGARVVGFVSVTGASRDKDAPPGVAEVPALYVDPTVWRRGIGRALIMAGLTALNAAGANEVTLWALEGNERGRAFFTRCGFAPDGTRRDSALGLPEVRLRRTLAHQAAS